MDLSYKNELFRILDAIGYAGDREAFVKKFNELIQLQAIDNLINSLPQDGQKVIRNELVTNKDNPEKVNETLNGHFSEKQIQQELEETFKNALTDWMQAVSPTLSDFQKHKLLAMQ